MLVGPLRHPLACPQGQAQGTETGSGCRPKAEQSHPGWPSPSPWGRRQPLAPPNGVSPTWIHLGSPSPWAAGEIQAPCPPVLHSVCGTPAVTNARNCRLRGPGHQARPQSGERGPPIPQSGCCLPCSGCQLPLPPRSCPWATPKDQPVPITLGKTYLQGTIRAVMD